MDERADCTETPERKTNVNNGRSPTLPFLRPSLRETEGHDEATRDLLFLCDQLLRERDGCIVRNPCVASNRSVKGGKEGGGLISQAIDMSQSVTVK